MCEQRPLPADAPSTLQMAAPEEGSVLLPGLSPCGPGSQKNSLPGHQGQCPRQAGSKIMPRIRASCSVPLNASPAPTRAACREQSPARLPLLFQPEVGPSRPSPGPSKVQTVHPQVPGTTQPAQCGRHSPAQGLMFPTFPGAPLKSQGTPTWPVPSAANSGCMLGLYRVLLSLAPTLCHTHAIR